MTEVGDQAVQAVTGRPCLIAEMQARMFGRQALDQTAHALGRGVDLAEIAHLTFALAVGDRDRVAHLCDIDPDENLATLLHGSPSCGEDRPGASEQPSKAQCRASPPRAADIRTYVAAGPGDRMRCLEPTFRWPA